MKTNSDNKMIFEKVKEWGQSLQPGDTIQFISIKDKNVFINAKVLSVDLARKILYFKDIDFAEKECSMTEYSIEKYWNIMKLIKENKEMKTSEKSFVKEYKLSVSNNNSFEKKKISSSEDAYNFIRQFYKEDIEIYESCFLLMLDRANQTIGWAKISQGGIIGTIVDTKIVCKYAIDSLANSVILAHNHPTGNLNPSEADKTITRNIAKALKVVDSKLLEHLIITSENYYSFADNGLIF